MINEVIKRQIKTMGADEVKKALAETKRRLERNPASKINLELLGLLEEGKWGERMKYPELNGKQWIPVQMKFKGQDNWRNGMFYINCGLPVFASYGSEVTEKVTEWRYWDI